MIEREKSTWRENPHGRANGRDWIYREKIGIWKSKNSASSRSCKIKSSSENIRSPKWSPMLCHFEIWDQLLRSTSKKAKKWKGSVRKSQNQFSLSGKEKDVIQTLVKKERFTLGMTKTRFGCQLMQIESHVMKDCIQWVTETLGIQMVQYCWKGKHQGTLIWCIV